MNNATGAGQVTTAMSMLTLSSREWEGLNIGGERERDEEDEEEEGMEKLENGWPEIVLAVEELSLLKLEEKQQLATTTFIAVSNLLIQVLDKIGPTLAVLRNDIHRNIQRLEDLYVLEPSAYGSLEQILKKEMSEGSTRKAESCSRAILWLTRSLDFSVELLERLDKDSELSLEQAVEEAYKNTLKPCHGWISTAAYKVAMKLIPERKIFITLLMGKGQDSKMLKLDIQNLMSLLQPFLNEIHVHLKEFRLDRLKST